MESVRHAQLIGKHGEAGFTLPEIMLAISIIVISVFIAVPNFMAMTARSQLKGATTELRANLNAARMGAMARNRTVTMTLAGGGAVPVTATFTDAVGRVLPPITMNRAVTGFGGPAVLTFNSLGLCTGCGVVNQTITLTNNQGVTFSIQVTPGGKTKWCPQAAPTCAG
ncbi:MAG: GspH/FimT family pseudopilin [Nitrospiraceae bacterium]